MPRVDRSIIATFLVCTAIIAALAIRLVGVGFSGLPIIMGLGTFACYLAWYIWLGIPSSTERLARHFERMPHHVWLIPILSSLVYGVYCLGTGYWTAVSWRVPLYFFAPFLVITIFPSTKQKLCWQDVIIIMLIWFPVDFRWLQSQWPWPPDLGSSAYTITSAVPLIAALMIAYRRLEGVKYDWRLGRQDVRPIIENFMIFFVFAVPFGLATGFIKWSGFQLGPEIAFTFLITFLWIAVPEELLFRGFIQNLLQKTWTQHRQLAMWTASILFGLAHLNNDNQPIWAYVVLASVAGYLYGRTFNQCRSIVPAVIVHTLVDVVWIHFFRG